jgi:sorbitol-specific phosphotransferase system component IIA
LASIQIFADRVSEREALKKAQTFMPGERFELQKYISSAGGQTVENPFYIFNIDNGGGYVIVSGNDKTTSILGYSTNGNIDLNNIPDNLRYWLESYAEQLKAIDNGTPAVATSRARTRGTRTDISPLIQTTWNQDEPYNLMCPDGNGLDYDEEGYDPTFRSVTGCVATAVAQVMYYHQWPKQTTAIPAYSLSIYNNDVTLKELPATTLEWSKMKLTYDRNETGASADAVAKLMRYVGQAFQMGYSPSSSGANILTDAMINCFNYSKKIHEIYRDEYSTEQWENMVYDELSQNRPIPYSGFSQSGAGHQFVCDGYQSSTGFFHLNWGWGGNLDGFFILSIADPDGKQGIGGSDGAYKYGQACLLNFMPAEANEEEIPIISTSIPYNYLGETYTRNSTSENFTDVSLTAENSATYTFKPTTTYDAEIGWGLYQNEQLIECVGSYTCTIDNRDLNVNWHRYWTTTVKASFGKNKPNGKYELHQMFRKAGTNDPWTLCDGYGSNSFMAEINGTSLRISKSDATASAFTVNSISVSDLPYVGCEIRVTVNLTNIGDSNQEQVSLWVAQEGTGNWQKVASQTSYISKGETGNVTMFYTPTEAGTFSFKVTSGASEEPLGTTSFRVADVIVMTVDDIVYSCIPDYRYAIVAGCNDPQKTTLTIPSSIVAGNTDCAVREIGDYVFDNYKFSEIILPSSLRTIGNGAFESCYNLKSITIPEGTEVIDQNAFWNCYSLNNIVLPSSLAYIGEFAFTYCSALDAVVSHIAEPTHIDDNAFTNMTWNSGTQQYSYVSSSATLYVPVGTKSKYEAIVGWTKFKAIEEGEVMEAKVGDLNYSYVTGSKTATVIAGNYSNLESVTIPATITINNEKYQVKAIGNRAFNECYNIESLTIAEGIERIGEYAFYNDNFTELVLPSSLKEIGTAAFEGCSGIQSLTIPEGVEVIGPYAFWSCSSVPKVVLPSSLTYIGELAFNYCSTLTAVVSHITEPIQIDDNAFATRNWNSGTQQYEYFPSSATLYVPIGTKSKYEAIVGWTKFKAIEEGEVKEAKVGDLKYSYTTGSKTATVIKDDSYSSLTSVTIPATVTIDGDEYRVKAIGSNAFGYCWELSSITIANGIEEIGYRAFQNVSCSSIALPSSLKTIGNNVFEDCSNLESIDVPEGVENIGSYAFSWCNSLQKITLPSTLKSIGGYLIRSSSSVSAVISHLTTPIQIAENIFGTEYWNSNTQQYEYSPSTATLYVPIGTKSKYEAIAGWTMFKAIEEGEVKEAKVGDLNYSYSTGSKTATVIAGDYSNLESVTIPATVTIDGDDYRVKAIGNNAFGNCERLSFITIANGIEEIGYRAFQDVSCSSIALPSSLKIIGNNVFEDCYSLKSIDVPEGVESIGDYAFSYCGSLQKITLPSTLKSIGEFVIHYSSSVSAVTSHLTPPIQISENTFITRRWNSSTQQSEYIPSTATLYVPIGTKSKYEEIAGWTMFKAIEEGEVKEVKVGDLNYSYETGSKTATVIAGDYDDLESVTIPATVNINNDVYQVKAIANRAFYECYNIESLTIAEGIESIGERAFVRNQFSELVLPSTLKEIGVAAFEGCGLIRLLTIPEGVEHIGQYAFWACGSLQKLILPSTLTSIGEYVINYCSSLNSVVSNIVDPFQISDDTFVAEAYDGITQQYYYVASSATLYVPIGTKSKYEAIAGWTMFKAIEEGEVMEAKVGDLNYSYSTGTKTATVIAGDYDDLESVTIPATVTIDGDVYRVKAIGNNAFGNCWELSSITIANGIEEIGYRAFQDVSCSSIALPSSLKTIGNNAFEDCGSLKSIDVPEGVESIGDYAFSYCGSLQKITLPSTLKSIGGYLIHYSSSVSAVISHLTTPIQISNNTFGTEYWNSNTQQYEYSPSTATLYVPIGTKSKYEEIAGWTMFRAIEEGEVKEAKVGDLNYSYSTGSKTATVIAGDYSNLQSVTIPATITINNDVYQVKAIGNRAFSDCYHITSMSIPEGIELIGAYAFDSNQFSELVLPSTLKEIGEYAFAFCSQISLLTIPEGVERIGRCAFRYCGSLQKLILPSTLTRIGDYVVTYCSSLNSVVSHIANPFQISYDTFTSWSYNESMQRYEDVASPATLYVPAGTKSKYEAIEGWTMFQGGIEEIARGNGDANGDDQITKADVMAILGYLLGDAPDGFDVNAADLNGDGMVTITDALLLMEMIQ